MKRFVVLLGAILVGAALLASCAPTATGPVRGRIVSNKTGQEGQVSFTRGTLQPRLSGAYAADNAVVQIGGQTYTGRTVMISAGSAAAPVSWGVGFDFGPWRRGQSSFGGGGFGWGGYYDAPNRGTPTYTGNLIARTAGASPRTLTCQLIADAYERGVGSCVGNDGTSYALQF